MPPQDCAIRPTLLGAIRFASAAIFGFNFYRPFRIGSGHIFSVPYVDGQASSCIAN